MMYLDEYAKGPLLPGLKSCELSRAVELTVNLFEKEGVGKGVVGER